MPKCQFPYRDGSTCNENAICLRADKSSPTVVQLNKEGHVTRAFFSEAFFGHFCYHHQALMNGSRSPQATELYDRKTVNDLIVRRDNFLAKERERRSKQSG